jgi:hypothetical protein
VKYQFGPAAPVAHLSSGDILRTKTFDCFGNVIRKPTDTLSLVRGGQSADRSVLCRGRRAGRYPGGEDRRAAGGRGPGRWGLVPGFGGISSSKYTPVLNADLPEKIWLLDIDHAANTATLHAHDSPFKTKIPLRLFSFFRAPRACTKRLR